MILENEQIIAILKDTDWMLKGKSITRGFKLDTFLQAISFVNAIADIAEEMDHHPEITIRYDRVKVMLTTNSEGGVTEKDIDLADAIDGLLR